MLVCLRFLSFVVTCSMSSRSCVLTCAAVQVEGCNRQASYAAPEQQVRRCLEHKLDTDIYRKRSQCAHSSCDKIAYYGDAASLKATHCRQHAKPSDVHVERFCAKNKAPKSPVRSGGK
eukprot:m.67549 g.67549  ORF g.67549 m.67549 type:complete len:118 (-) comp7685_c0_seq1:126-479(-)